MSITILEVLENALYNLKRNISHDMGIEQLENAIYLLGEKDKGVYDKFDEADLSDKEKP